MRGHRTRRALAASVIAVLTFGLLAACGSGDDKDDESGSAASTLRLGSPVPPTKFDPATSASGGDTVWLNLLYDRLINLDPETLEPTEGGLAESWEFTDELTFHITLRDGVTFSDGTPLDAEAVKQSIDRFQEIGVSRFNALATLESIEVTDDLNLDLKLSAPDSWVPERLAGLAGMIVSPAAVEESPDDITANPIGAGPYSLTDYVEGSSITLERNDDYWGEAPAYQTMKFTLFANTVSMVQALQAGQLDVANRVPFADQKTLSENSEFNSEIAPSLSTGNMFLLSANPDNPGHDPRVRQAINLALDREAINEFATEGYGEPTNQLFSTQSPFHSDEVEAMNPRDVDKARELVSEAYPDGVDLKCVTYTGSYFEPAIPTIVDNLKEIGINVEIQVLTVGEAVEAVSAGDTQCHLTQIGSQVAADIQLRSVFQADTLYGGQTDPEQLISQDLLNGVTAASGDDRVTAVGAALKDAQEKSIVISLFTRPSSLVLAKSVAGYEPHLVIDDLRSLRPAE